MPHQHGSFYCGYCRQARLFRRTTVNHVLHLILTIFTCGLFWTPIWIIFTLFGKGPWMCAMCGQPPGKSPKGSKIPNPPLPIGDVIGACVLVAVFALAYRPVWREVRAMSEGASSTTKLRGLDWSTPPQEQSAAPQQTTPTEQSTPTSAP
jgi:hypothetical protein